MKKIIAISVMFALVAGAAFADTSIGGGANMRFDLARDKDQVDGDNVGMGNYGGGGSVDVNWSGDNAGGQLRIYDAGGFPDWYNHTLGWWKPIDQLKIQIGQWDGFWGFSQIVGWGFTNGAKDVAALDTGFAGDSDSAFMGGFGSGLGISVYPADGFEINIGIPVGKMGKEWKGEFEEKDDGTPDMDKPKYEDIMSPLAIVLSNTYVNVKAGIPDIGTVKLGLILGKDGKIVGVKDSKDGDLFTSIYFAFYLSALEDSGMGAELGLAVTTSGETDKKNDDIKLGIGFKYEADDFGIKAGLATGFGDAYKAGDKTLTPFSFQILPYYNLGSLTAFLNVGFLTMFGAEETEMDVAFNPYVQVPISTGNFFAGVKVLKPGNKDDKVKWSIPIGFTFGF